MDNHGHKAGQGGPRDINLAVLGARGVGKSALVVRYLTRRFIGDYDPDSEAVYSHQTYVDGKQMTVHIRDTSVHSQTQGGREDIVEWADGFLLVFSLTDLDSFHFLQELIAHVRGARGDEHVPCVVAANKADLVHTRRVSKDAIEAWANDVGCQVVEVSASEDVAGVEAVFTSLCRAVRTVLKKREKLSKVMARPGVAAKLQIRQSLRNFAERTWRSRTSTL